MGYDNYIDTRADVLEFLESIFRDDSNLDTSDRAVCEKLAKDDDDKKWIVSEMKLMAEEDLLKKTLATTDGAIFYIITSRGVKALETDYNHDYQYSLYKKGKDKERKEIEKEQTEKDRFDKNYNLQIYGILGSIGVSAIAIVISIIAIYN